MPWRANTLAMIVRPTSWPRFHNAPRILVGPARAFTSHANDEHLDLSHDPWAPCPTLATPVVLLCHELPEPAKERVWTNYGVELFQSRPAQRLCLDRQQTSLLVRETDPPSSRGIG